MSMNEIRSRRVVRIDAGAQRRGLVLLIGAALLVGGILLFDDGERSPDGVENRPIALENVYVTIPSFDASGASGTVNVNTATLEDLTRLPGIGPVLAGRIVAYREEHGRFASVDTLAEVKGIGPETIEGFQERAIVASDDQ